MTEKNYCHDVSNIIDLYIHDELDSYGKETVEEHIAVCDECRLLLDCESGVVKAIKKFGDETPDIASAVMKRIIDDKLTVAKPKRRFSFAPSLIPAAVAIIAVTLFSRTNIMKMMEKNFDSANSVGDTYESQTMLDITPEFKADKYEGTEVQSQPAAFNTDESAGEPAAKSGAEGSDAGGVQTDELPLPEKRSFLLPTEEEVNEVENGAGIEDITDEYDEEIFNTVKGKLDPAGIDKKEAINTLIVLNGEDEALLAELLQDIEYEEINGIIMADISAYERFKQNADENEFNDFKIYQEDTESDVLAFTFEE